MTIKLELNPEIEARLVAQAAIQGISVDRYLESLIEDHLAIQAKSEWIDLLDQLGKSPSLAKALPLTDEAMNRDSIYRDREDQQL